MFDSALLENFVAWRITGGRRPHGVGPQILFWASGWFGRMRADAEKGVNRRTVRTCEEPSERGLAGGSCQPSGPRVSGEKSWLPESR